MGVLRLLITDPTPPLRRSLDAQLQAERGVEVVGRAGKSVDLLMAVSSTDADVVVLYSDENDRGILSHLFAEFPDLTVLTLAPSGKAYIEQYCPMRWAIADQSSSGLVAALRQAIEQPCSEAEFGAMH